MAESGHAINVSNLGKARDWAQSWPTYKPSNPVLDIGAMTTLFGAAGGRLDDVQNSRTAYRNATAACDDLFDGMGPLVTRVMRMLRASGVVASVIEDAETYSRKIKGERATPAKKDDPATPDIDESKQSHSASQMSRTQRLENFDSLLALLKSQPLYNPNESDLRISALTTYSDDLHAALQLVETTFVVFSNAMAARDDSLYLDTVNVVETGRLFKTYVQAGFGRNSTEWQQVRSLQFKDMRRE
jgi:hypothetical protein